ncbi:MAG: hypothetical protein CME35_00820 [Gramella sp.]|nr:hypothetical protein [Christiangramia sp.]|tara:strand:- start:6602 stop:6853 length:252 start_codon:yes stop_codon:yes gene_type:complete
MKILTWVFCEDCFRHDYKCHEVPNFQSSEVKITKARNHFDSVEVTFDCLNCKEQKRKHKNKKSLVGITTDQPHDNSGVTHPYL